jgi:hypothetical protein
MTVDEAKAKFRLLVQRYGLQWTAMHVPQSAWDELAKINKVTTEQDRRDALKGK